MIIHFDPKTMHVQVVCGISEKYEPTEAHESILKKVEELKLAMAKFRDEVLTPGLDDVNKIIENENNKFKADR
jgi:hypothetical protein